MSPEKSRATNPLIEQMAADLQPVRTIKFRDGLILVALAVLATVLAVELVDGLWRGAWSGDASAFFLITNGLLLVLGCASASSVLNMATPRVGNPHEGPKWAMAMAAVLPLAAFATLLGHGRAQNFVGAALDDPYGLTCFGAGLLASMLTAGALIFWLRRGAPVSPTTAGLHIGVASTALGSVAYGLACPIDGVVHLGLWHAAPVVAGALIGRFALPPLLRW
ncbi:hypothetical protein GCM10023115_08450 [Pontixanthobacter gangjinensis]|uniref:DUF1109 family protein n=1 Tax=Pontixanthobacter gangjinensis TaxID=1028742 RepID=A0A6I4SJR2_9SPHN|nr:DUF1109 domain-containing protein [Pontixanthobacter gangjinensis]MXO56091.1 DUF1109 family protein [Pontixanthobacter gangjinensis]